MRKLGLVLAVTLIVVVGLWAVPRVGKQTSRSSALRPSQSYASPPVSLGLSGPAAVLAQAGSTFPATEAGLAAYLRVSPLSMEKVLTAFDRWEHYGNWLKGSVLVKRYPVWNPYANDEKVEVRVYVDSQGWVVAFLEKSKAPANIMVWDNVAQGASNLQSITTTALEEALKKTLLAAEVDFASVQGRLRYYHFQYPAAKNIGIWAKVASVPQEQKVSFRLSVVLGSTIYSESVFTLSYHGRWRMWPALGSYYGTDREWAPNINYGGRPNAAELGSLKMTAGRDYLYSVYNSSYSGNQTMGVAVVIIYNLPQ